MRDFDALRLALFPDGGRPLWGMVLGSGFHVWLDSLGGGTRVPFEHVPGMKGSTVAGHGGFFTGATVAGAPVAVVVGRLHLYEGLEVAEVVAPVRTLAALGVENCLVTCAAGAVSGLASPGEIVAVRDQINLTGLDPATGTGVFPDCGALYDPGHLEVLRKCGHRSGVLAGLRGPSYETPAEARALAAMGADLVCMSTVLEVLDLSRRGVRIAGLAAVANRAGSQGGSHEKVLRMVSETAGKAWEAVNRLIGG